jgi:hypothetical protein
MAIVEGNVGRYSMEHMGFCPRSPDFHRCSRFVSGKQLKATKMVMQPRKILGFSSLKHRKRSMNTYKFGIECVKCVGVLDEPTVKNMKVTRENRP